MSDQLKVLIGSRNPMKYKAAEKAFSLYCRNFKVIPMSVCSGVYKQPQGINTYLGAKNRVKKLIKLNKEDNLGAEYFLGIESGITNIYDDWYVVDWVCIADSLGDWNYTTAPCYKLPDVIIDRLLKGEELGEIMDDITGEKNIKCNGGAIKYYSKGLISREDLYCQAIILALIPYIKNLDKT